MSGTAVDKNAVVVGTNNGPGLWLAPVGTALPTDHTTALDPAFVAVGFISDDGVTISTDTSQTDLFAWQSVNPIRSVITERTVSFEFTCVETTPDTLALYFDTAIPAGDPASGFSVTIPNTPAQNQYSAVIDVLDGQQALRFVFEATTLSDSGDIEITRSGLVGYPVTLKVLASDSNAVHVGPTA